MKLLQGVKVVELGRFVAAPMAGRLLSEWGANVIKIETGNGDPMRMVGELVGMPTSENNNPAFDIMNGHKDFIKLNLKDPEELDKLKEYICSSDIFITNYREQALKALGIDFDTISKINTAIVYGQVIGYGDKGREASKPAYDFTAYYARGGISGTLHDKDSSPLNAVQSFGDIQAANFLTSGVLAAYIKSVTQKKGSHVTVSLYHTALFNMGYLIAASQYGFKYPISRFDNPSPLQGTYKTKDNRWIQLAIALHSKEFDKFCSLINRNDLAKNMKYRDYSIVSKKPKQFIKELDRTFMTKTADEWVKLFEKNDLPCEKLMYWDEILQDKQALENEFISEYLYEDEYIKMVNNPVVIDNKISKIKE